MRGAPKKSPTDASLPGDVAWARHSNSNPQHAPSAIGGIGAGAVYGTCVGNALKWFPARHGLAAGITAAGFGMGSAATVVPIAHDQVQRVRSHLPVVRARTRAGRVRARPGVVRAARERAGIGEKQREARRLQRGPKQVLASPIFWVTYLMFVMMAAGGLIETAQLGPIAKDFGLHDSPVSLLGLTLPVLTFALTIDRGCSTG